MLASGIENRPACRGGRKTMNFSRRDLCVMLSALAASPVAAAQEPVLESKAYPYEQLTVREAHGNQSRGILAGKLHDGCFLEVHQTRLAPGAMPHPPHHHVHEEMFFIREGDLELTINGHTTRLGPGSAGFVGSNDEHGIRNIGTTPAEYFVAAFGKDA
jgi:mannose-6-phosphate isomerase-like protein (cupin superfamily)